MRRSTKRLFLVAGFCGLLIGVVPVALAQPVIHSLGLGK